MKFRSVLFNPSMGGIQIMVLNDSIETLCSNASVQVRGCGDEIVSGWRDVTDIEHWRIGLGVEAFVASVGQNYDMP